jgi:hypothetical protein
MQLREPKSHLFNPLQAFKAPTASLQGTEVIAPELVASVQGVPGKSTRADAGIPDPKYL